VSTTLLVLALAACIQSAPAAASPLFWEGTLSIEVLGLPPIAITGGGVATVDGPGGAWLQTLRLAASRGGIEGAAMVPITDPSLAPNIAVRATASLGTGSFAPISGGTGTAPLTRRVLPLRGLAKLCLFSTSCGTFLPLPLTQQTPEGGLAGVGVGGVLTVGGGTAPLRFSIEAAPWTLHTATVVLATAGGGDLPVYASGFVHGAGSVSGSTAAPGGAVQLVTPIRIISNQGSPMGAFGRLTVRFLPEPGWLVLLAAGLAGLGLLELARSRS
jgi:hypothetical protein